MEAFLRLLPITLEIFVLGSIVAAPYIVFWLRQLAMRPRQESMPKMLVLVRTRVINYQPRTHIQIYCEVVTNVNAVWEGEPGNDEGKRVLIKRLLDSQLRHDKAMRQLLGLPARERRHWSQRLGPGQTDPMCPDREFVPLWANKDAYSRRYVGDDTPVASDDWSTTYEPA